MSSMKVQHIHTNTTIYFAQRVISLKEVQITLISKGISYRQLAAQNASFAHNKLGRCYNFLHYPQSFAARHNTLLDHIP